MESKLEEREREIFKILKQLSKIKNIILVGGYAMNAYSDFPRFSLDCDLVVDNLKSCKMILQKEKFKLKEANKDFKRYEKTVNGIKVGVDLLIGKIIDRQSGVVFLIQDLSKNSSIIKVPAKSNPNLFVKFNVASPEILFVTKLASLRKQDVRDVFMLANYKLNKEGIKNIMRRYFTKDLKKERITKVKLFLESEKFLHSLQGVYGKLPQKFVEKNKKVLLSLLK